MNSIPVDKIRRRNKTPVTNREVLEMLVRLYTYVYTHEHSERKDDESTV
jgi:hypothetical protein